ncbi:MAG: cell division/cell wall cluster transcriptional repressor MraZ [Yoonia sp.]|nr:cell division/cell wall cluster transcriptional repressor MraZ [Yoonia sp.]
MVLSFTGEHTQKVDGKGRMSIPADFRRVLEAQDPEWTEGLNPRMYLLYGEHLKKELHVYTVAEFGKLVDQINAMPKGSPAKKKLSHLYIGQSMKMEIDKDGRTVMPIRQREKLGLKDGELYFRGVGDHFEIWKAETFNETVAEDMTAWLDEMPEDFDPLSLLGEG